MNRSDYKDLQTLADDLALLIELKKANELKEQEDQYRAGKRNQIPSHTASVRQIDTGRQQVRPLGGY